MGLRVAVVTQDEPFYMPLFYRSFFDALGDGIDVRWVTVLSTFDESFFDLARRTYRLYGPWNFVKRGVGYVARTVADAVGYRSYSVASVVRNHDVPVDRRRSVNTADFVQRLTDRDIDVVLSVSAPEVFEPSVLDAPRWGCLNVHTSKLPKYRGLLPTFWALYHDDDEFGVTVHTMAEEIDHGKIVRQSTVGIPAGATLDDVIKRGKREGGRLAAAALDDIAEGTVTLDPMDGEESYFGFPTVAERREFQRRGKELL